MAISEKIKIELGPVQKTLLIPLWARAVEYEKKRPIIRDKFAHDIISRLDFDFQQLSLEMTDVVQINCSIRAYHIDDELRKLIELYPHATIVNLGAGLDTTFWRVDNGLIHWYDLDMPDSIALREQLLPETDRCHNVVASAFDKSWYKEIKERGSKVIFFAAGVLVYFSEEEVKGLLLGLADEFPHSEIIFEIYSKKLLELRKHALAKKEHPSDMLQQMKWGIDSGRHIKRWSKKIKLVKQYNFYSRIPVTPENRKIIKQFWLINVFKMFRMVHLRLG